MWISLLRGGNLVAETKMITFLQSLQASWFLYSSEAELLITNENQDSLLILI